MAVVEIVVETLVKNVVDERSGTIERESSSGNIHFRKEIVKMMNSGVKREE